VGFAAVDAAVGSGSLLTEFEVAESPLLDPGLGASTASDDAGGGFETDGSGFEI
jgi:hypothetical protein